MMDWKDENRRLSKDRSRKKNGSYDCSVIAKNYLDQVRPCLWMIKHIYSSWRLKFEEVDADDKTETSKEPIDICEGHLSNMNMRKFLSPLTVFFLFSICAQAQIDPLYAQYLNNPLLINPAYSGLNNNFTASATLQKTVGRFWWKPYDNERQRSYIFVR